MSLFCGSGDSHPVAWSPGSSADQSTSSREMCSGVKEQNESPRLLSARTAPCPTADAGVLAQQVVLLGDEAVAPVPAKVLVFEAVELCTDAELQPCPEVRLVYHPHSPQTTAKNRLASAPRRS